LKRRRGRYDGEVAFAQWLFRRREWCATAMSPPIRRGLADGLAILARSIHITNRSNVIRREAERRVDIPIQARASRYRGVAASRRSGVFQLRYERA
jgi:hypothetical protein